jgi:hypothetical protein
LKKKSQGSMKSWRVRKRVMNRFSTKPENTAQSSWQSKIFTKRLQIAERTSFYLTKLRNTTRVKTKSRMNQLIRRRIKLLNSWALSVSSSNFSRTSTRNTKVNLETKIRGQRNRLTILRTSLMRWTKEIKRTGTGGMKSLNVLFEHYIKLMGFWGFGVGSL